MRTHIPNALLAVVLTGFVLQADMSPGMPLVDPDHSTQHLVPDGPRLWVKLKGGTVVFHNERIVEVGGGSGNGGAPPPAFRPLATLSGEPEFLDGVWLPDGSFERRTADGSHILSMKVEADASGEELRIVSFGADAKEGGLSSIRLLVENCDMSKGAWILPARGGMKLDASRPIFEHVVDYPTYWGAQMAVYQTRRGGFSLWSTDTTGQFKFFRYLRSDHLASVAFETQNPAPFEERKSISSVEWRLRFFEGDWRVPATAYRDWMAKAFDLTPLDEEPGWAKGVRGFINVQGSQFSEKLLDELAGAIIPDKTILYLPNWRRDNYDVNYPDYAPNEHTPPFVKSARDRGFHVMLHTDLPGVSAPNPAYASMKQYHVRTAVGGNLVGWFWDQGFPHSFAFINPAASAFRSLFVDRMKGITRDVPGTDAIHLDVSAPMWNDGNGLIEGMNYGQGSMALHRELLAALPSVTFGGESINELTVRGERFFQRWDIRCPAEAHPIETFLFWPYARPYGYLGLPNPDRGLGAWFNYTIDYESWSVLPTLTVQESDTHKTLGPRSLNVLREMRVWQERGLEPDWAGDWSKIAFKWKDSEGRPAAVSRKTDAGTRMECGRDVLWERVSGVTGHRTNLALPDWPAFDKGRVFGLNPNYDQLFVQPDLVQAAAGVRVVSLSRDAIIDAFQAGNKSLLMSFRRENAVPAARLVDLYNRGRSGVILNGVDRPMERGAVFAPDRVTGMGRECWGFAAHPPWQKEGPTPDFAWGQSFADFPVRLPDEAGLELRFAAGKDIQTGEGDGVTFIVKIDGAEIWRGHAAPGRWTEAAVDVSPWRGKSAVFRLITDPGPAHDTGWDRALWLDPVIVRTTESPPIAWRLQNGDSGECPPGERIVKFLEPPVKVTMPQDLRATPFECALDSMGLYRLGSAWGSGAITDSTASRIRRPSLNGHPPDHAKTILRFALELPESARRPVLTFHAGVSDGSTTGGLAHIVLINGEEVWRQESNKPGWTPGEVDLSPWIGRAFLLDLVTDSLGDAYFDWAVWGEPGIVEKG